MSNQHKTGPIPEDSMEMPKYKCHKEVWALKIGSVKRTGGPDEESDGNFIITPDDNKYAPFVIDGAWVKKHKPKTGGYYILYKDSYASYSPAQAFEDGYTRIS